jgi:ABC-type Na+ efflux pump permease subunit
MAGMFYVMFGNLAGGGEFNLPRTQVIVANLDEGGPRLQTSTKNIPGSEKARTMGELVVNVLQSDEMAELAEVTLAPSAQAARTAVDTQVAQVAIIIPADFSRQFADLDGQAAIEFYQDPTLTIGPDIIRTIMNRFMDGMAGVKIAVNVFMDEADPAEYGLLGPLVQRYLDDSLAQVEDPAGELLEVTQSTLTDEQRSQASANFLVDIVSQILGGMMVFYAFFTGASTAQSILKEEEERTLPRLFTTPTPQAIILSGKFLSVFATVLVQVIVLLAAGRLIFNIHWGAPGPLALTASSLVLIASTFGICMNSFLKSTRQGGIVFGGVLTITGMLGMISIMAIGSPAAARMGETVSLLVPQGWAVRGLRQVIDGQAISQVALTSLTMLAWSAAFFGIGVWRFNRRYV